MTLLDVALIVVALAGLIQFARCCIHPATYRVRHDNGESFEVQGLTLARVRKLIESECQDRGWLMQDIDWWAEPKGEK